MGCRCEDISKYNDDLELIREARTHATHLCSLTDRVRESVDTLGIEYAQTLNVDQDFYSELKKVDEDDGEYRRKSLLYKHRWYSYVFP